MAQNTIADLSTTAASNTDFLSSAAADSANANKIGTNRQNLAAIIARFYSDLGGQGTVGGTGDAVTLTSASTYQTLESGLVVSFKAGADNTGAVTLNLDSLGAKAVRLKGDTALSGGEIIEDGYYLLIYDSGFNSTGAWVLLNPEAEPAGSNTAVAVVTNGSLGTGTAYTVTDLDAYSIIIIAVSGASHNSGSSQSFGIKISDDNGSNYSSYYAMTQAFNGGATFSPCIMIFGGNATATPKILTAEGSQAGIETTVDGIIDALWFGPSAGNIDAGSITIIGIP